MLGGKSYVLSLLVLIYNGIRLSAEARDRNRSDFGIKGARRLRRLGTLVRANGIVVLLFAGETVFLGTLLGLQAHDLLLAKGVGQSVLCDAVHQGLVAVFGASAHVGKVVRRV